MKSIGSIFSLTRLQGSEPQLEAVLHPIPRGNKLLQTGQECQVPLHCYKDRI
jgi:hypothetical protein